MKKIYFLIITLILSFFLVACSNASNEETKTFKVGLLLTGPSTDGGWNQSAYDGLTQIKDELGAEVSYAESVQATDYEKTMREYAKDGNNLIIGHGYQFVSAAEVVAAEYPDITFIVTSATITNDKNLGSINNAYTETGFLQGAFAAMMTKTNVVAAVGGMEIPPIVNCLAGFKAGAIYINPNIKALSAVTGSFDDANKAQEQAKAFIAQGADVLMADANQAGRGVYVAAEEKGLWAISSIAAEYDDYTKGLIACGTADMAKAIFQTAKEVQDGTYTAAYKENGIKEGICDLTYSPTLKSNIPAEVLDKIDQIKKDIVDGKIDVAKLIG
ncbi:MAG: BMP family protein [Firmicutes bacterium]|nr:BMP family protein [Bacillota bacterium]